MLAAITAISEERIQQLYPGVKPLAYRVLQDIFKATGMLCNIVQGLRTLHEQDTLFQQGRTTPGPIVTNSKGELSWHPYGLAFDIARAGNDPYLKTESEQVRREFWNTYGRIGKSYGMKWGGDFHLINGVKDLPHLEMKYGLTIDQAIELYSHGGLASLWAYIDRIRGVY